MARMNAHLSTSLRLERIRLFVSVRLSVCRLACVYPVMSGEKTFRTRASTCNCSAYGHLLAPLPIVAYQECIRDIPVRQSSEVVNPCHTRSKACTFDLA